MVFKNLPPRLQGHKARTWVVPQDPYSIIKCRIDLKLVGMCQQIYPTRRIMTRDLTIQKMSRGSRSQFLPAHGVNFVC